jgi:dihydroxyacetone kinase-like predicted kinase
LAPARFIAPLEALGDSVLVVGDEATLKVHVHTDEPERATAVFAGAGEVSRLDVADMRLQVAERDERLANAGGAAAGGALLGDREGVDGAGRLPSPKPLAGVTATLGAHSRCGAVAVVSGAGLAELFAELGVHTIDGGPTLNPSTYDLLAAIHEVPAEEVVVLANSPNVIMAAEHAAELSDKQVLVAATVSQQAGLVAAVALSPDRTVEENARALADALARVRTGAVAEAARDDAQGRFKRGEAVGFVDEEMLAWGDPSETLRTVVAALTDGVSRAGGIGGENGSAVESGNDAPLPPELISVIAGAGAPLELEEIREMVSGGEIELELRYGGQAAYWWLLAAE